MLDKQDKQSSRLEYVQVIAKIGSELPGQSKKFSIDPKLTNLHTLRQLLVLAFDIKWEFTINYLMRKNGKLEYFPVDSNRDLDKAISFSTNPLITLQIDCIQNVGEWNVIDYPEMPCVSSHCDQVATSKLYKESSTTLYEEAQSVKTIFCYEKENNCNNNYNENEVERAILNGNDSNEQTLTATSGHIFSKKWFSRKNGIKDTNDSILNQEENVKSTDNWKPFAKTKAPLSKNKFDKFFDLDGRLLVNFDVLKLAVYQGGAEITIRPSVWRFLLRVADPCATILERKEQDKKYAEKYIKMRNVIIIRFVDGIIDETLRTVANAVRKDVVRTDRTLPYFGGKEDENEHLISLFYILTTYALAHPSVSYCQGMSDLASPILYVMRDEAEAYVCFCALMNRMKRYFSFDSNALRRKFDHMGSLLRRYEPEFWGYLSKTHTDHLLFCYRWFLLELKREFKFNDALTLMEIMWASMPEMKTNVPFKPVVLFDVDIETTETFSVSSPAFCNLRQKSVCNEDESVSENEEERSDNVGRSKAWIKNLQKRDNRKKTTSLRLDCLQKSLSTSIAFSCPDDILTRAVHKYFMENRGEDSDTSMEGQNEIGADDRRIAIPNNRLYYFSRTYPPKDRSIIKRLKILVQKKSSFKQTLKKLNASPISDTSKWIQTSSCCNLNSLQEPTRSVEDTILATRREPLGSRCRSERLLFTNDKEVVNSTVEKDAKCRRCFKRRPRQTKTFYSPRPYEKMTINSFPSSATSPLSHIQEEAPKRARFCSTSKDAQKDVKIINNGRVTDFDHLFEEQGHSDSDDSGIGTTSSLLKDYKNNESASTSGSIASSSDKNSNFDTSSRRISFSPVDNLLMTFIFVILKYRTHFHVYSSLLQYLPRIGSESSTKRRETFNGFKYGRRFGPFINSCIRLVQMYVMVPIITDLDSNPCISKCNYPCNCDFCANRVEKSFYTERVQFPTNLQDNDCENVGEQSDLCRLTPQNDIEDLYDSFVIIQHDYGYAKMSNLHNQNGEIDACMAQRYPNDVTGVDHYSGKTLSNRECTTFSSCTASVMSSRGSTCSCDNEAAQNHQIDKLSSEMAKIARDYGKETRLKRINDFFFGLFRRSSAGDDLHSSRSSLTSRETTVKDEISDEETFDCTAEPVTAEPIPLAVDAVVHHFEDVKRRLTLSHIHDLCMSSKSSSAVSSATNTNGVCSPIKKRACGSLTKNNCGEDVHRSSIDSSNDKCRISDETMTSCENTIDVNCQNSNSRVKVQGNGENDCENDFVVINKETLPPPNILGDGNPFMLFVCLTIFNEHCKEIMKHNLDYNEVAVYFDKLLRKHNAPKVFRKARVLYADYLKSCES